MKLAYRPEFVPDSGFAAALARRSLVVSVSMRRILAAACLLLGTAAPAAAALPLVAVIDSGIAATPELKPLLEGEVDVATKTGRAPFQPRYDHGTMVATILARAAGDKVRILSYRIDDPAGCPANASPPCQPSAAPIAHAIRLATEAGVDAINLSLSLKDDPTIAAAVQDATAKGVRVVMAAGNDGLDHPVNVRMAEAGYPRAVLVGALDAQGRAWAGGNAPGEHSAGRYNYVWQRGVDVPTRGADNRIVFGTGTSFAVPIETARLVTRELRTTTTASVAASGLTQTLR
jgi:hypothetical protein